MEITESPRGHGMRAVLRSLIRRSGLRRVIGPYIALALREFGSADLKRDLVSLVGSDARTIVDVGAWHGEDSALYAQLFPRARIHAFEPDPRSYAILNKQHLVRTTTHAVALGATNATRSFNLNSDSGTNSFLSPSDLGMRYFGEKLARSGTLDVQVRTLDDIADELGIVTVDLLKVDVQGYELAVFTGSREILERTRVVQVECNFVPQYEGSSTFAEVDLLLRAHGFRLYNLYDLFREAEDGRLIFGDGLYLAERAELMPSS